MESSPESQVASSSSDTLSSQNLVFSNVGSEILQPVVAPGLGHKKKDSFGGKGKNSFDLADFEGDTSTPFELVELQTINDLDELKNVLQPNMVVPATTAENSSSSYHDNKAQASASASAAIGTTTSTVSPSGNSLIDITGLNACDKPSPSVTRLPDTTSSTDVNTGGPLLVDIGEPRTSSVTPQVPLVNNGSVTTNSLSNTRLFPENRPLSRGELLPPIGHSFPSSGSQQLQGQSPLQISTHASDSRNSFQGGIYSFPPMQGQPQSTINQDTSTQYRQYSPPSTVSGSREPQWKVPSLTPEPQVSKVTLKYIFI